MTKYRAIIQPLKEPFGDILKNCLTGKMGDFYAFHAVVAFLKRAGFKHIQEDLKDFVLKGKVVSFNIGIDRLGTSYEGLLDVLECVGPTGEIWVNQVKEAHVTFHPKLYLFEGSETSVLIVGSNNITEGGLYTNDEISAFYSLDMNDEADINILKPVKEYFMILREEGSQNNRKLDRDLLEKLLEKRIIIHEVFSAYENVLTEGSESVAQERLINDLFGKSEIKRSAPKYPRPTITKHKNKAESTSDSPADASGTHQGFIMTLQKTDVGIGQTSKGTSRRSPEIFIPLAARDYSPGFWGWNHEFIEDGNRPGKFDRLGVQMRIGTEVISVNMMTWPIKHDFRLRSEMLRSAGNPGDILRIEKIDGNEDFSYYVEVIPQGTSFHEEYLQLCVHPVRNSQKKWGYYN